MPPKRDLRLIDEHFESESMDVSIVSSSDGKTVKTVDVKGIVSKEEPKPVKKNNFSPSIIEDWVSESEEENEPKFQKQALEHLDTSEYELEELEDLEVAYAISSYQTDNSCA
nr:hypothetical protein [Tanacetum cinerariifolium]